MISVPSIVSNDCIPEYPTPICEKKNTNISLTVNGFTALAFLVALFGDVYPSLKDWSHILYNSFRCCAKPCLLDLSTVKISHEKA